MLEYQYLLKISFEVFMHSYIRGYASHSAYRHPAQGKSIHNMPSFFER